MPEDAQATPVLPICTVQHDFNVVVKDVRDGLVPEDTFWVSCYKFGEPSVHGKAVAALDEHNRNLVLYQGRDGVDFKASEGQSQITAFDVAPDGSQIATGYHDGSVYIRPTTSSTSPPTSFSKSHLSTVTSIRFFPSSRVILTAGADFSLSILSADPPESPSYTTVKATPARTLRGHTRAITSTAIIARGRNVLSGSKDGTVRLWDIPTSSQIRTLAAGSSHFVPVLALSFGERWGDATLGDGADDIDAREVETSDKVVFCGLQDGSFELFDLRTKHPVFRSSTGASGARSALQALAYSPDRNLVATGSAAGLTSVYDVRTLGDGPVTIFRRNEAPIEDIVFEDLPSESSANGDEGTPPHVGLVIATEDGLPYIASIEPSRADVHAELVGTDCDAVRLVRAVGRHVWTAADDGVVRRYAL
ncbi:Proteasomal ATPase-associated factor 1 [Trametes pubescens]|uniref:Proteasomal ATPase-associated factor 1 n=1 Tax=Trametes pubescens TaxID=154538 RepID=A0A1M2VFQ9_TRAPU|nr:Proteasomal ATPase-associated factor 1 [Trametes pubescens]